MSEMFRSRIGRGLANFGMQGTVATEDCKDTGGPLLLFALGDDDDGAIVWICVCPGCFFSFVVCILVVRKLDVP